MTESDPILAARNLMKKWECAQVHSRGAPKQEADLTFSPSDQGAGLTSANEQEPIACGFKTQSTIRKGLAMKVVSGRVHLLLAALTLFALTPLFAQSLAGAVPEAPPTATEPIADPLAVVRAGHARFTVLTPELIRVE